MEEIEEPKKKKTKYLLIAGISIAVIVLLAVTFPTYDDDAFFTWSTNSLRNINIDINLLSSCNGDIDCYNEYGARLREDAEQSLREVRSFSVSPTYQYIQDEYEETLLGLMKAGNHFQYATTYDDILKGLEEGQTAIDHLENITIYLKLLGYGED